VGGEAEEAAAAAAVVVVVVVVAAVVAEEEEEEEEEEALLRSALPSRQPRVLRAWARTRVLHLDLPVERGRRVSPTTVPFEAQGAR
jgi:hypothetical protein